MNIQDELQAAKDRAASAQQAVRNLESRLEFEQSFESDGNVYLVIRRDISSGRFVKIEGAFLRKTEALRFAQGLPGYGLDKDLSVDSVTLFR